MRGVFGFLAALGLVVTAVGFAPALYLFFRASGDPAGIVDGLLRLTWLMPIVWLVSIWLQGGRKLRATRNLLAFHGPLLVILAACSGYYFGVANDSRTIVAHATPLTRAEQVALADGQHVYEEGDLGPLTGAALWAHAHLPPCPFDVPRS